MRVLVQGIAALVAVWLLWNNARMGNWVWSVFGGMELVFFAWTLWTRPVAITRDLWAWVASAAIAVYPFVTTWLVRAVPLVAWRVWLGSTLQGSALVLEIAALATLRTAFTQVPEARHVVRGGVYRWVRHPLYMAYFIAFFGECVIVMRPLEWVLFALFVVLEVVRARAEERILESTFGKEYRVYRYRTGMFAPRRRRVTGRAQG